MNSQGEHTVIILLVASSAIRNYMLSLCRKNNYDFFVATGPEDLVRKIKKLDSTIAFVDFEAVTTYGAWIYSRINATGADCNVILLSDENHRSLIKEAMEFGVYACILAPYEKWEVLTMVRNILSKKKCRAEKKHTKARIKMV
ncbi:MAG: response regulator [Pseudomonadota bacterium]|uniref:Response regulatory domain-containing protein n=1 Tax=Candidatus Desulfatibia profunda TaxID=2841695 RepID=A0A8J6TL42_9BACT|nr:hypothetical protein [Candidatus Desulfatibia profunda]